MRVTYTLKRLQDIGRALSAVKARALVVYDEMRHVPEGAAVERGGTGVRFPVGMKNTC